MFARLQKIIYTSRLTGQTAKCTCCELTPVYACATQVRGQGVFAGRTGPA